MRIYLLTVVHAHMHGYTVGLHGVSDHNDKRDLASTFKKLCPSPNLRCPNFLMRDKGYWNPGGKPIKRVVREGREQGVKANVLLT